MLSMSEDFLIDLSPSCTKEQAVLRLLGWGKETIKKKYIVLDHNGKLETEKEKISLATMNLHEYLTDTYKEAVQRYENAIPENPTEDQIYAALEEHGPRITETEADIEKARNYFMDITDELGKQNSSLRIDQETTTKEGKIYITIRSLEEWAANKYNDSSQIKKGETPPSEYDFSIDDTPTPKNLKAQYSNLLISFSIAVKYIAEDSYRFKYRGVENIQEISDALSRKAQDLANTGDLPMAGQGTSAIRDRIKSALQALKTKIPHA